MSSRAVALGSPQRQLAFVGRGEAKAQLEFFAIKRKMEHCGLCFDEGAFCECPRAKHSSPLRVLMVLRMEVERLGESHDSPLQWRMEFEGDRASRSDTGRNQDV